MAGKVTYFVDPGTFNHIFVYHQCEAIEASKHIKGLVISRNQVSAIGSIFLEACAYCIGYLELHCGDIVFSRNMNSSQDPIHDIFSASVHEVCVKPPSL